MDDVLIAPVPAATNLRRSTVGVGGAVFGSSNPIVGDPADLYGRTVDLVDRGGGGAVISTQGRRAFHGLWADRWRRDLEKKMMSGRRTSWREKMVSTSP